MMYRILDINENLKEGDEYFAQSSKTWRTIAYEITGRRKPKGYEIRRKINANEPNGEWHGINDGWGDIGFRWECNCGKKLDFAEYEDECECGLEVNIDEP